MKRLQSTIIYALLTTIILEGGLFVMFQLLPNGNMATPVLNITLGLVIIIGIILLIGTLWGLSIAWVNHQDYRQLAITGAIYWGGLTFLFALILEAVNAFHVDIANAFKVQRHYVLLISFMIAIFTITTVSSRAITKNLGHPDATRTGLYSGLAAALGFLIVDRILFSQGWVLGRYMDGRSVMMTVAMAGNTAGALFGGAVMGWMLGHQPETTTAMDSQPEVAESTL